MWDEQFGVVLAVGPPRWKSDQELWWKEANRRGFPRRGQSLRYRLIRWPPLQATTPKLSVLHSPNNLVTPPGSDVRSVLTDGHVISSRNAGWGGSGWIVPPVLFSFTSTTCPHPRTLRVGPLRGRHGHHSHVLQADGSRQLPGVETQDLHRWLIEWSIAINVSKSTAIIFARAGRHFIQPRPVSLFGETIQCFDTSRHLGVTIDTRLTWSPHID